MAYITDRFIHDADAHIMEPATWLRDFADPQWRDRMPMLYSISLSPDENADPELDEADRLHADPSYRSDDESQIMLRKNFEATGSYLKADRPQAIDQIGVLSQLVFNTFASIPLVATEHRDPALAAAMSRAHNRGMADFCSEDQRMLGVAYVPLADFDDASAIGREAIDLGAAALMIPSACPADHSPSHIGFDPLWAMAQDAGVPIVLHVGGGHELLSPKYFENGMPPVPDFHGGAENFRSVDYMAIPYWPMQTLCTMIFDGVMDRFPRLKFGVIEQGASWAPGWLRNMDSAFGAFRKNEERLQRLRALPSEIAIEQIRVTPYPHEDTGWIVANTSDTMCMFSSDYPHVEGGRNPLNRFDTSLASATGEQRQRFYFDNFVDLMGDVLVRHGLPTELPENAMAG